MSEQKVRLKYREKMEATIINFLKNPNKRNHTHLNLLDGNKLLKGGLIK